MSSNFKHSFKTLTGNGPFPWQEELFARFMNRRIPTVCDIPTGLGKTTVIAVWLLARAAGAALPRRLVYVVNRRTVVDQTTEEVDLLRSGLVAAGVHDELALSTLRGQHSDNRAWSADPSRQAVICGTVDMIGSRLLFSGYRVGFKGRPLHAGFLGQDALLVHDEAHLEPAFQALLDRIVAQQERDGDPWPLRVMQLTATSRASRDTSAAREQLGLSDEDFAHPEVAKRIGAVKRLSLHRHGDKDLPELTAARALECAGADRAVLVFLRTVDDVAAVVARLHKAGAQVQQLTGTMRGYEREQLLARDPIFARFMRGAADEARAAGPAVLVCTSAGEVGVNLSADHLVCDLSTFDSMAQRFGRVNRFGTRADTEIHVLHPAPEKLNEADALDRARLATLRLLSSLGGDASPRALGGLDMDARLAAFAPLPRILPVTEILFDAWAMTTIRQRLPGRPPVSDYLHGVAEWEPPTAQLAWRDEVDLVQGELLERYPPQDLLDDYPLKPHELLADQAKRIATVLAAGVEAHPSASAAPVWLVEEDGGVQVTTLGDLVSSDRDRLANRIAGTTVLLSARRSRPIAGVLSVDSWRPKKSGDVVPDEAVLVRETADVADAWRAENGTPLRHRVLDDEGSPPHGMRVVRVLSLSVREEGDAGDGADAEPRRWSWYIVPRAADDEGSGTATQPVRLDVHSADVEKAAKNIVDRLRLDPGLARAVTLAAKHHDHGKNRRVFQRSIGNFDPGQLFAKSGGAMRPLELSQYRHELGSLIDAERGLLGDLAPDERDLALHLIAAHHGRARPHFPDHEMFDPEAGKVDARDVGLRVLERFARLQRRFGRWGLAYLESLVRAADYAASANPSVLEDLAGAPR